jgi:hypothetical protein
MVRKPDWAKPGKVVVIGTGFQAARFATQELPCRSIPPMDVNTCGELYTYACERKQGSYCADNNPLRTAETAAFTVTVNHRGALHAGTSSPKKFIQRFAPSVLAAAIGFFGLMTPSIAQPMTDPPPPAIAQGSNLNYDTDCKGTFTDIVAPWFQITTFRKYAEPAMESMTIRITDKDPNSELIIMLRMSAQKRIIVEGRIIRWSDASRNHVGLDCTYGKRIDACLAKNEPEELELIVNDVVGTLNGCQVK